MIILAPFDMCWAEEGVREVLKFVRLARDASFRICVRYDGLSMIADVNKSTSNMIHIFLHCSTGQVIDWVGA